MYFLLCCVCIREFVLSLPLPKHSILPYIPYSSPHHSSSPSCASREHVRACAKQALPKSLLIQNFEGLRPLLQALYGTATPTDQINSTGIVLHRPCHQSDGWRKGWLLTTVKLGTSESLHWAVNISTSA